MPSAAQREADRYHSGDINRSLSGRGHLLPPFSGSRGGYFQPQQEYYEKQYDTREPRIYTSEPQFLAPPPAAKRRVPGPSTQPHPYESRQHSPTTRAEEEIDQHLHRSRSASLPLRQQSIGNVEPLDRAQSMSKIRKPRPRPLQIPPVLHRPAPDDPLDEEAPYTPSILALYSPSQDQSPNSKTRSLPTYRFQASDFPATESDKPLPSPWFQLSPEISSAAISVFSPVPGSASSQSSISSFSHNFSDADCGLQESPRGDEFVGMRKQYATVSHLVPNVSTMGEMSPRYF